MILYIFHGGTIYLILKRQEKKFIKEDIIIMIFSSPY